MQGLRRMLRQAPVLSAAFALALLATLWFGGRFVAQAVYWSDPAHQDQTISGWMTPGYVARSWRVPREVVANALDLPAPGAGSPRPPPLEVLARERDVPLPELVAQLTASIEAYRAAVPADP